MTILYHYTEWDLAVYINKQSAAYLALLVTIFTEKRKHILGDYCLESRIYRNAPFFITFNSHFFKAKVYSVWTSTHTYQQHIAIQLEQNKLHPTGVQILSWYFSPVLSMILNLLHRYTDL